LSNQQSTFQNDQISVKLERRAGCKIHLEITVSPQATKASYQKALKNVSKEVSIPGFRKGKAPTDLLKKNFEKHIDKEWKELLLDTAMHEAFELTKIYPFNRQVHSALINSASLENGASITIDYEAAPAVPRIEAEALSIPPIKRKSVAQKDIELVLEDLQLQQAEWNDIVDRPAQEGDFAFLDIETVGENPRTICKNSRFAISPGKMGDWMRKLVIGMTPGQSVEGMSEKEEEDEECEECEHGTHEPHTHDFVPTLCHITLLSLKNAVLPSLDDELAKKFGAENVDDLKIKVEKTLNNRADEELKNAQRYLMEKALLDRYPFELPQSLLHEEIAPRREALKEDLRSRGFSDDKMGVEIQKMEAYLAQKLDQDFRLFFLTQRATDEFKIEVSQDEVTMELMRQMWLQQMGQNTIDTTKDPKEIQSRLKLHLQALKTLDYLIAKTATEEKA